MRWFSYFRFTQGLTAKKKKKYEPLNPLHSLLDKLLGETTIRLLCLTENENENESLLNLFHQSFYLLRIYPSLFLNPVWHSVLIYGFLHFTKKSPISPWNWYSCLFCSITGYFYIQCQHKCRGFGPHITQLCLVPSHEVHEGNEIYGSNGETLLVTARNKGCIILVWEEVGTIF